MTFPSQPDSAGANAGETPANADAASEPTPAGPMPADPTPAGDSTQVAWGGWTWPDPVDPAAPDEATPAGPTADPAGAALPPAGPPDRGRGAGQDGGRRASGGSIILAAILAAALAAAGTLGVVELTLPQASATPSTPPAQLTSTSTTVPTTSGNANQPIVQIAANAGPAVVTITSTSSGFGQGSGTSIGSGFIVRADGYILTNRHVIASGGALSVQLADGRQFDGTVVGTDPDHDLAVVKISATGLPTLTLGDSDKLAIGQLAIAIGDPLGTFSGSVTSGVISGTGRSIDVQDAQSRQAIHLSGLLQTDAAINEGNSGGPLLNAGGQVIGINTATDSTAQGIGFAVPINTAANLLSQAEAGNATTN